MAKILPLSSVARLVAVNSLLDERNSSSALCDLLATDIYSAVSEDILKTVVSCRPDKLTNKLLTALCPPHIRSLSLRNCSKISVTGIAGVLSKCSNLNTLDLSDCDQLMHVAFFIFLNKSMVTSITSLTLENNEKLASEHVRSILSQCHDLKSLNVSQTRITDDAFIITPNNQVIDSVSRSVCSLTSIDVSGCRWLTTAAVAYMTRICGPSLQHINISYTEISCISLCYLSGYDAEDVVKLMEQLSALEKKHDRYRKDTDSGNCCNNEVGTGSGSMMEGVTGPVLSNKGRAVHVPTCEVEMCKDRNDPVLSSMINNKAHVLDNPEKNNYKTSLHQTDNSSPIISNHGNKHDQSSEHKETYIEQFHSNCIPFVYTCPGEAGKEVEQLCVTNANRDEVCNDLSDNNSFNNKMCTSKVSCDIKHECDTLSDLILPCEPNIDTATTQYKHTPYSCDQPELVPDIPEQKYIPCLNSIEISCISYNAKEVYDFCLKLVFLTNPHINKLIMSYKELKDDVIEYIADHGPHLRHIAMCECEKLTSQGVATVCNKCPNLTYLNLHGVYFISDQALFPLWSLDRITYLNLAECNVTDVTLKMMAKHATQLQQLDLSWCEELMADNDTTFMNSFIQSGSSLQSLRLRHLPLSEQCVISLAQHCVNLERLNLSSVGCLTDSQVLAITLRCKHMKNINVSWNPALTDVSASAILRHLVFITDVVLSGIKQLTSKPFLPIIADVSQWRRCQALLRLKLQERHLLAESGDSPASSDEEFEELYVPHRSTSYAPCLRVLELEYCDKLNDTHLAEIAAVCRGTLRIMDYYGSQIEPCYITCQRGKVYKSVQYME